MKKNNLIIIGVSVIMTIVIVALVNVGFSIFIEEPQYSDTCATMYNEPIDNTKVQQCTEEYNTKYQDYNQMRFYIFSILGVISVLIGLFISFPTAVWTGLLSGGVLLTESVIMNFTNKKAVFIMLLIILGLIIAATYKVLKKK